MIIPLLLFLFMTSSTFAKETTKSDENSKKDEARKDEAAVSDGRIFNMLANSNTVNSGTLSSLALLGFAGVAVVSLLVPFIMSAFGLAMRSDIFGGRRGFSDISWSNDWIRRYDNQERPPPATLVMRLFERLGVKDTECQKLIVCEVQRHPVTRFGTIGHTMTMLFSHPYSDNEVGIPLYKHLHEAWSRGNVNEDCIRIYSGCTMLSSDILKRLV